MAIPLRAKNPPESYPYYTLGIIAVNALVFLCTINPQTFGVREGIAENLGLSYNNANIWRIFSSMFVHENFLHIGGNMLFLWIFGASVEGRLKNWKYLTIYFAAGVVGALLQMYVQDRDTPDITEIGASGAIMGVLGAYLYMFPHSRIQVFRISLIRMRIGLADWKAIWFIGLYILSNVINLSSNDHVCHVAHLGGFAIGYLGAFLFRPHTDSDTHSEIKCMLHEVKDHRILTLYELEVLLAAPQTDSKILMAYCQRALMDGGDHWALMVVNAMKTHQNLVIDDADPREVASFLLAFGPNDPNLLPLIYLRIGSKLEQMAETDLACHIYRRVYDMNNSGRDAETALYRLGRLLENNYNNPLAAIDTYNEMLKRFPTGSLYHDGVAAVSRLSAAFKAPPSRPSINANQSNRRALEFDPTLVDARAVAKPYAHQLPTQSAAPPLEPEQLPQPDEMPKVTFGSGRMIEI